MKNLGRAIFMGLVGLLAGLLLFAGWLWLNRPRPLDVSTLAGPADHRILIVGNSYTEGNQLDQLVKELMLAARPDWQTITAARVAPGGYTWATHAADAENAAADPLLRQLLISGSPEMRTWDLVIFQDQSQIGGFQPDHPERQASLAGVRRLASYAAESGATVMFMMTWGQAGEDQWLPEYYPDYLTAQARLAEGYDYVPGYVADVVSPSYVAPVGLGFQVVYEDITAEGGDPLAADSAFMRLYAPDGRHPSLAGSYLAAAVISAAYLGQPMAEADWRPSDLNAAEADYLRGVADRVVFEERFPGRSYPPQP